jgi:hypothetical protein
MDAIPELLEGVVQGVPVHLRARHAELPEETEEGLRVALPVDPYRLERALLLDALDRVRDVGVSPELRGDEVRALAAHQHLLLG